MIVRCPECSTGFKLPVDRVGPKGAKVRCTKCDHVFRVRIVDEEPEIFYKPGEEPAKSSDGFGDFGNQTAFGGPHSFAASGAEDSEVRESGGHTAIGRPGDLANIRSTPRKPLASISRDEAEEAKEAEEAEESDETSNTTMAAGIINKRTIKKNFEPDDDEEFSGPGSAHAASEADDATAIGKPVEDSYTPKATSFGLPAVGGGDDPFDDDDFSDDSEPEEDTARTSFGFPADSRDDAPEKAFGQSDASEPEDEESDASDDDDHLRGTAFGRPAFDGDEASEPEEEEPSFGENPKGTLFGLPAVGGDAGGSSDGDDGLDLFSDEAASQEPEEFEDDPFAGAFEDKIDDTPVGDVSPSMDDDPFDFDDDDQEDAFAPSGETYDPNMGIDMPDDGDDDDDDDDDDAFFMGGGGGSDFGDASSLVDPSFGADGPSFDPNAGESADDDASSNMTRGEIDLGDEPADDVDLVMETNPPPAAERERGKRQAKKSKKSKKSKTSKGEDGGAKPAPASVSGQRRVASSGEASAVQKVMNFLLIVMLVVAAFIGVVLFKTGGVIDFARFDHMLGIVIEGKEFEPRPEWGIEKRKTDDLQPLQITDVFAFETDIKDGEAFLVRGDVSNVGTSGFGSVKVRVSLVGPDGAMLADQVVPAGTKVDSKKLADLAPDAFDDAVERQMSNIDPDASIPFVAIFEEMPVNSIDELDILVEVTEKTEIPKDAK